MPELPEVETIRQDLRKKIIGKKIKAVEIISSTVARGCGPATASFLRGKCIQEVDRIGKLLIFLFAKNNHSLTLHLKMTGQLIYVFKQTIIGGGHSFATLNAKLPDRHTRVIFTFHDGSKLFFNDLRKFGYIKLVDPAEKAKIIAGFGIEPLTPVFTLKAFAQVFKNKKTNLKALLLNQKLIAGVGNIYADEICHAARILPFRRADSLKTAEVKRLFLATQAILKKAITYRGTTFNNYVDSEGNVGNFSKHLKVYGAQNARCKTCRSGRIQKTVVAGRGTHFCVECQR